MKSIMKFYNVYVFRATLYYPDPVFLNAWNSKFYLLTTACPHFLYVYGKILIAIRHYAQVEAFRAWRDRESVSNVNPIKMETPP